MLLRCSEELDLGVAMRRTVELVKKGREIEVEFRLRLVRLR